MKDFCGRSKVEKFIGLIRKITTHGQRQLPIKQDKLHCKPQDKLSALKRSGGILILTTDDAHATQYIGQPFIHKIQKVGSNCGVISNQASVSLDIGIVWMSELGFSNIQVGKSKNYPAKYQTLYLAI